MKKGKIITIEGTDGTGKKTQTKLLVKRASDENYPVYTLSFPDYDSKWGQKIKKYLSEPGKTGEAEIMQASWLYALDRAEKKPLILQKIKEGHNIILDRYMESNFAHQGAKLEGEQRTFMVNWLKDLETKILDLPQSDIVIFLDLPVEHSIEAMRSRKELDIHEADKEHQKRAYETYKMLSEQDNWVTIPCLKQDMQRYTKEELSEILWKTVEPYLVNKK